MRYAVQLTTEAYENIEGILTWITEQSVAGAMTWSNRFDEILDDLAEDPQRFPLAPESNYDGTEIRQIIFRTRRGKPYRVLFSIQNDVVYIRHIRGPGQDFIAPDEI